MSGSNSWSARGAGERYGAGGLLVTVSVAMVVRMAWAISVAMRATR